MLVVVFLFNTQINSQTTKEVSISFLHTNDTHSRIEQLSKTDKKYPNRAGYANRSAVINKIRKEQLNVVLLDAGDFLQGTPYFNYYKGALEVKLMNRLGYIATTLGNHEFDLGVDHLSKILKKAKFKVLNCNYDVSNTSLKKIIKKWMILKVAGVRVGITGVGVNPEGLITPENFKGIVWNDPIQSVNDVAKMLKNDKKCDYVICLSHLGYEQPVGIPSDIEMAKKSSDVDLILGGHTHTLLERPDSVLNSKNTWVYVAQNGSMGVSLSHVNVVFRKK